MYRALMLGITMLALVAFGGERLFPGETARDARAVASMVLFLQFPLYLCLVTGGTAILEAEVGPLEFHADVPPRGASPSGPTLAPIGGVGQALLLAVGLSVGLPVLALAAFFAFRATGDLFAPVSLVFTPTLAVAALFRRPRSKVSRSTTA